MNARPLVIGCGAAIRGDDGAGLYAARLLENGACTVIACHQLTPELAEAISRASVVVFVDADVALAPGEVRVLPLEPEADEAKPLMHHFDPKTLLRWSRQLYGASPEAWLVGIGPESFDLGETLSPAAESGAREAAERIRSLITP